MAGDHRDTTAATMTQARRLLGIDPIRAAALARQALQATPHAIEVQFLLGAALRRSGDLHGALEMLAPLSAGQPGAWGLHYEHGMTLAALGQSEAAVAVLDRATTANPQSSLAWHALGDQLTMLGRADAAAAAHARMLPGSASDPALAEAAAALFDGSGPAAREALRTGFGIDLNDVAAVRLLADVGVWLGREEEVAALLAAALKVAPGYLPVRFHYAAVLYRLERSEEALEAIEPLFQALSANSTVRALRAAIHMQLGREKDALGDFAAALAAAPEDARLWLGQGHALRAVGRQAEAVQAYRHAIELEPTFGEAWWSLANLKTWRFEPADIDRMQMLLADKQLSVESRSHLHFALGKAKEDAAHHAEAFRHYHAANAARRSTTPYDAAGHADFIRRTIATFSPAFLEARAGVGLDSPDPIFVLGMPRSGSTLVEQMLASHSRVEGASELPYVTAIARDLSSLAAEGGRVAYPESLAQLPLENFAALGADYLARTRGRRPLGRPFFVDKFPGNFLHVGLIHLMLPRARIVDVRRHPLACCMSLFKQSFARGQAYSYDLGDLGRYFADYGALMSHVDAVLPGRVLHLSYEAIVDDPEYQLRRLLDYCGLDFEPACLSFFKTDRAIRTPSSEQVRRPIFRDGLDQWRHYQRWIAPLVDALGALADGEADRP